MTDTIAAQDTGFLSDPSVKLATMGPVKTVGALGGALRYGTRAYASLGPFRLRRWELAVNTSRRLEEGSQAVGLALRVGRAERALHHMQAGAITSADDEASLKEIANFLAQVREGLSTVEAVLRDSRRTVGSTEVAQLRAFDLVMPVVRLHANDARVAEFLARLIAVAERLSRKEAVPVRDLRVFVAVLGDIAGQAMRQSSEVFEAPRVAENAADKRAGV